MTVDIKQLEIEYFCRDLPVPYNTHQYELSYRERILSYKNVLQKLEEQIEKNPSQHILDLGIQTSKSFKEEIQNHKIQFYITPPLMSDYNNFYSTVDCFLLNVNDDLDVEDSEQMLMLMNMSYLEYMIWANEKHPNKNIFLKFRLILSLVLKIDITTIDVKFENEKPILVINDDFSLDSEDIKDLKKIICFQNINGYKDEYISKAIEDELKVMRDIKGNKFEEVSLERRISSLSVLTHEKEEDIWNMTIRRFNIKDEIANDILRWSINSLIEGMGKFKFEKPIPHYLYKLKKSGIDGFVPYQEIKNKIDKT